MKMTGFARLRTMKDDPEKPRKRYPALAGIYSHWVPVIADIAKERGYCVAVHGSMATDLDIVAIPWTSSAPDAGQFIAQLVEEIGFTRVNGPEQKPHGRLAWSLGWGVGWFDISVMPLRASD